MTTWSRLDKSMAVWHHLNAKHVAASIDTRANASYNIIQLMYINVTLYNFFLSENFSTYVNDFSLMSPHCCL